MRLARRMFGLHLAGTCDYRAHGASIGVVEPMKGRVAHQFIRHFFTGSRLGAACDHSVEPVGRLILRTVVVLQSQRRGGPSEAAGIDSTLWAGLRGRPRPSASAGHGRVFGGFYDERRAAASAGAALRVIIAVGIQGRDRTDNADGLLDDLRRVRARWAGCLARALAFFSAKPFHEDRA